MAFSVSVVGSTRAPLNDPDKFDSFGPGLWWSFLLKDKNLFKSHQDDIVGRLMVPMDSRTTASPCASKEYVFYRDGAWSWSIPWIAGLYALAVQVKPDITPDEFWNQARETGQPFYVEAGIERIQMGWIANPVELIRHLEKRNRPSMEGK